MTALIVSITADNWPEMLRDAANALARGADLAELRLDRLKTPGEERLAALPDTLHGRAILTLRPVDEGGEYDGDERQRLHVLAGLAAGASAYVDLEFARVFSHSHQTLVADLARAARGIILSSHDLAGVPADLDERYRRMCAWPQASAVKLAWPVRSADECFAALDLLHNAIKPTIAIGMGEAGLLTRVLAPKVGAFGTYCAVRAGDEAAPGQLPLEDMVGRYRWKQIGRRTELYGVVGWPVSHSLSPHVHNAAFAEVGRDAVYVPLAVEPREEALAALVSGLRQREWLDARGLSVTVPHKESVLRLPGVETDAPTARIGAANTLMFDGDRLRALNTDCPAAIESLLAGLGVDRAGLARQRAAVFGAGGVARAIVAGLCDVGCAVTVFGRSMSRAAVLVREFKCGARAWEERADHGANLLVNCTTLGLAPHVEESPLSSDEFAPARAVFETIYNPRPTRLLREAAAAGLCTIDGLDMFLRQAEMQFTTWTGQRAPADVMRRTLR
jgi:3-dehydroquinate dehydratase/shikimate dehydrogenase